ncbi:unnamed protein product, partial [Lampetra planeri]
GHPPLSSPPLISPQSISLPPRPLSHPRGPQHLPSPSPPPSTRSLPTAPLPTHRHRILHSHRRLPTPTSHHHLHPPSHPSPLPPTLSTFSTLPVSIIPPHPLALLTSDSHIHLPRNTSLL